MYNKVGKYETKITSDSGITKVRYFGTCVVWVNEKVIELNTGGYFTVSTKRRMNQASVQFNLGYRVFSHKGEWYVNYRGKCLSFIDSTITLVR
jgi:hypothetical protein